MQLRKSGALVSLVGPEIMTWVNPTKIFFPASPEKALELHLSWETCCGTSAFNVQMEPAGSCESLSAPAFQSELRKPCAGEWQCWGLSHFPSLFCNKFSFDLGRGGAYQAPLLV